MADVYISDNFLDNLGSTDMSGEVMASDVMGDADMDTDMDGGMGAGKLPGLPFQASLSDLANDADGNLTMEAGL